MARISALVQFEKGDELKCAANREIFEGEARKSDAERETRVAKT